MEITHQKRRYTNRVITLLTDFGYRDGFVGSMKGVILGINPGAQIVDISHEVQPQNIDEAGFILFSTYNHFPEGTIHVAVVDPGVGSPRKIIAVKTRNYIFLSPDNGLLKYIFFREKNCRVFEVTNRIFFLNRVSSTFHGRDIFAPVSAHLSLGTNINEIGKKYFWGIFGMVPLFDYEGYFYDTILPFETENYEVDKIAVIEFVRNLENISHDEVVHIGDGITDIPVFKEYYGISFNVHHEKVKNESDLHINSLAELIDILL